jgi:putative restriction endonuclease
MPDALEKVAVLGYYAKKFERLRVDRAHGVAPHKPILLLAVLEQIEREQIGTNRIEITPALIYTFLKYWAYLGSPTHNPDISRPFFHMKSGKFWHHWPHPGFEQVLSTGVKLKTFAEVKQAIEFAYLDEDLFECLQIAKYRDSLGRVLVGRWFSGKWPLVEEIKTIDQPDQALAEQMQHHAAFYKRSEVGQIISIAQ